jgi:alkanesulfonate monooxygenase SsuD/methylene tetrahydromethanopterin reductase-like flavin-dependent oxidoreductase (luciferase family)
MNVGLGLPIADPAALLTWARRADAGPFRTLGLLDRLVYHNPEPLVALAAVAGATSRIRVQTEVLLAPLRDAGLLAKQSATLDRMSGGRFTLGIGLGGRADDYAAAGVDMRTRGRRLDSQMATMRRIWTDAAAETGTGTSTGTPAGTGRDPAPDGALVGPIGPAPHRPGGPEVLFGAFAPAAARRVASFGDGLLAAAPPRYTATLFQLVERDWQAAGRTGRPRLVAQVNVALGPDATVTRARHEVADYYGFLDSAANEMAERMLTTPERVREAVATFTDLGADEVMLYCWAPDVEQIDRLADAVG